MACCEFRGVDPQDFGRSGRWPGQPRCRQTASGRVLFERLGVAATDEPAGRAGTINHQNLRPEAGHTTDREWRITEAGRAFLAALKRPAAAVLVRTLDDLIEQLSASEHPAPYRAVHRTNDREGRRGRRRRVARERRSA